MYMQDSENFGNEFCSSTPTHQGGFFPEFIIQDKDKAVSSPIPKPLSTLNESCLATRAPANDRKGEL